MRRKRRKGKNLSSKLWKKRRKPKLLLRNMEKNLFTLKCNFVSRKRIKDRKNQIKNSWKKEGKSSTLLLRIYKVMEVGIICNKMITNNHLNSLWFSTNILNKDCSKLIEVSTLLIKLFLSKNTLLNSSTITQCLWNKLLQRKNLLLITIKDNQS